LASISTCWAILNLDHSSTFKNTAKKPERKEDLTSPEARRREVREPKKMLRPPNGEDSHRKEFLVKDWGREPKAGGERKEGQVRKQGG